MGIEDFASLVVPTEILSIEEETAIFRFIGSKDLHPRPKKFLCTQRNRNFPLNIITSDKIEKNQILRNQVVQVSVLCNENVEVKSIFIGCCTGSTNLTVYFDNNRLNVTRKAEVDGKMQELKLGSSIILKKDHYHSLEFRFESRIYYHDYGYSNYQRDNVVEVFAVKRAKIVAGDDIVVMKLASDNSLLPVFGFKYTLAILNTPVKLTSKVQQICKFVQGGLFYTYLIIFASVVLIYYINTVANIV